MRPLVVTLATFAAAAILLGTPDVAPAADDESADAILARHELTRLDRVWVLPLELELRQDLAELPKRRERIVGLERELDQRIEQNRLAWQDSRGRVAALKQSVAKLSSNDPQRVVLQQQIDALEAAVTEPGRIGSRAEVRTSAVQWTAERNDLAAATVRVRRALPKLLDQYMELGQRQEVQSALGRVGQGQRLGPQRSYRGDMRNLGEYERLVFTPWHPLHLQAGQHRLTGLVDELSPLTFTWVDSGTQTTMVSATAAEAAGISVPEDAPRETVFLSAGRSVVARRVTIPYLRFSGCVLRDVAALVLPPEAEDWGSRIGREALSGHSVRLEPERLRLWIENG
ncbi:MAG TPA: retropepsin-like aspartic protease [Pirellulaceae bacterium]|nr:retropepsin-like aspartic protease [Pirellulaceae bacterium]